MNSRFVLFAALLGATPVFGELPIVDLSADTARQVVLAQGTASVYQGHPTTLLLPDGKTIYAVWTLGHGGTCGPMKRSDDGGRTWSELLPTPPSWAEVKNCPSIYRLTDSKGVTRLFVFAGRGRDGQMQQSMSLDEGKTWSPMKSNGLECVMPFTAIAPVDGGKRLIAVSSIRRAGDPDGRSNVLAQSESTDGGLTWSAWRVLIDDKALKPCEPALVRSPDGKQLLCMMRENIRTAGAHFMTSDDEGRTWSPFKPLPESLWGDRYMPHYAAGGRLVVCFRDTGTDKRTHNQFVAWVGTYDDIIQHREGQYKVGLLRSHAAGDCGYPGLELLPDGTFVATTYIKYREGAEKNSVVSTRFALAETDKLSTAKPSQPAAAANTGYRFDDDAATYVGDWVQSAKQQSLLGKGYRHDDKKGQGTKSARFATTIIDEGDYEVRLLYVATTNRATNVPVTIHAADGDHQVALNQKEECLVKGTPRALGTFKFAAGTEMSVTVSNKDANGFVVVDGLQIVPADVAKAERAAGGGKEAAPAPSKKEAADHPVARQMARSVALSPLAEKNAPRKQTIEPDTAPVFLAKDAAASAVDGKHYDLVVVGGTASGVACAVRAAREGCTVLLVQHNRHIGGMLSNGLMQWDALYGGPRAPLFTELLGNIEKHYIEVFGKDSVDHQRMRCTHEHYPISWVEPHVMERECHRLIAGEKNITLLFSHYPAAVEREGATIKSVMLREYGTTKDIRAKASMFADATYEGDLFAVAKVAYRVGREARDEFNEPHAGKVFCNVGGEPAPKEAVEGKLNIRAYGQSQGTIDATSPFTADGAVQAYNYRFCVCKDPANRVMLTAPPPGYNRDEYVNFGRKGIATNAGPNSKSHMNSPILPGENHAYPDADWPTREKIIERHKNFGLGLIWFLQNDESMKPAQREEFRQWGLAKDEFTDNGNIPYEMYVREARRIVGRHVFKEQDNSLAPGLGRTPIMPDSIGITDWYMDSHACTTESRPGFHYDGKLILTAESRPAQIPYRALLPQGVDNLLVPVCLSATHVAWGAIRLEPVWMQTGEAAGFAAGLAHRNKVAPAKLDPALLMRTLSERRQLISFFSDMKVDGSEPWIPAAQYFGTLGFFADYNIRADEPLRKGTAQAWIASAAQPEGRVSIADSVAKAESGPDGATISKAEFTALLDRREAAHADAGAITRGEALAALWERELKRAR
jgi:hypothetical protein